LEYLLSTGIVRYSLSPIPRFEKNLKRKSGKITASRSNFVRSLIRQTKRSIEEVPRSLISEEKV
jgi:hypothetical protein